MNIHEKGNCSHDWWILMICFAYSQTLKETRMSWICHNCLITHPSERQPPKSGNGIQPKWVLTGLAPLSSNLSIELVNPTIQQVLIVVVFPNINGWILANPWIHLPTANMTFFVLGLSPIFLPHSTPKKAKNFLICVFRRIWDFWHCTSNTLHLFLSGSLPLDRCQYN